MAPEESPVHAMLSEYLAKAQYDLKTAQDELSYAQSQAPLIQAVYKRWVLAMKLAKKERGAQFNTERLHVVRISGQSTI